MVIAQNIPGTSLSGGQFRETIQRPVHSLEVVMKWAAAAGATVAAVPKLSDFLAGMSCKLYLVGSKGQNIPVYPDIPLHVLADASQSNEGFVYIKKGGDGKILELQFKVNISPQGSYILGNNEEWTLSFQGLPTVADFTFSCYGIEMPIADPTCDEYHIYNIAQGVTERQLALDGVHTLLIPADNSAVQEVQIRYSNGQNIYLVPEELKAISRDTNDLVFGGDVATYGYSDFFVLDVATATQVTMKGSGTSFTCYAIAPKVIGRVTAADATNAALVDTTDGKIAKEAIENEKTKA